MEAGDDDVTQRFNGCPLFCSSCGGIYVEPVTDFCGHTYCRLCTEDQEFCLRCSSHGKYLLTFGQLDKLKVNIVVARIVEKVAAVEPLLKLKEDAFKLYKRKMFEQAISVIDEGRSQVAPDIFLMLLRCKCNLSAHCPREALEDVDAVFSVTNRNTQAYLLKAQVRRCLDRTEDSISAYLKCFTFCQEEVHCSEARDVSDQVACSAIQSGEGVHAEAQPCGGNDGSRVLLLPESTDSPSAEGERCIDEDEKGKTSSQRFCHLEPFFQLFSSRFCGRPRGGSCHRQPQQLHSPWPSSSSSTSSSSPKTTSGKRMLLSISLGDPKCCVLHVSQLIKAEDLECPLCLRIFLDPVTTSCGHTFCLDCMYRCLDHTPSCPLCKEDLRHFLASRSRATTDALVWVVENFFKDKLENRRKTRLMEMATLHCLSRGENVPIFVCTVAFPSVSCPLHIFEPRYKLLIRRCLDSETRQFGMCCASSGARECEFSATGTMLEVVDVQYCRDGRSVLHAVGRRRFRVVERSVRDGYHIARVEYISDAPVPEGEVEEVADLMKKVYSKCQAWFSSLSRDRMRCIILHYGSFPTLELPASSNPTHESAPSFVDSPSTSDSPAAKECTLPGRSNCLRSFEGHQGTFDLFSGDGPSWIWYMSAILPVGEDTKVALLSLTSVKCRLKYLDSIVTVALRNENWR